MNAVAQRPVTLEDFGKALKDERLKNKKSIAQLANRLRLSSDEYQQLEAGKLIPQSRIQRQLFEWCPRLRLYNHVFSELKIAPQPVIERVLRRAEPPPEPEPEPAPPPPKSEPIPDVMPHAFGAALRWCRLKENFTQLDVGILVECHNTTVSSWEKEECAPIESHYQKLLEVFPDLRNAVMPSSIASLKPGPQTGQLLPKKAQTIPMPPEVARPSPAEVKQSMVSWSKTLITFHNSPEKTQTSVKNMLQSAHAMGFTIPELLAILNEEQ